MVGAPATLALGRERRKRRSGPPTIVDSASRLVSAAACRQSDLVSVNALARLERGEGDPRMSTPMAVHKAPTEAGIEFLVGEVGGSKGINLSSAAGGSPR